MKQKVFIDARSLASPKKSGVGQYVAGLLRELDRQLGEQGIRQKNAYYLLVPLGTKKYVECYGFRNISIKNLPLPHRLVNFLLRKRLLPPIDILFGRGIYIFPGYVTMPLHSSKSVLVIYDMAYKLFPETIHPKLLGLLNHQVEQSALNSDHIITISNDTKKNIHDILSIAKSDISVAYPSVDRSRFYRRSELETEGILKKYDLPKNFVLAVGNLEPRKNHSTLLKAYASLPKSTAKKYSLVIAGADSWNAGRIEEEIKAYQAQGLSIIVLNNRISDYDLPALYSAAKVMVYPSLHEGFGMPPLESMACGTPVISSINSALPESIDNAAVRLKNAKDSSELSRHIEKMLGSEPLRSEYAQKGYERVDRSSTWRDATNTLSSIIDKLQKRETS